MAASSPGRPLLSVRDLNVSFGSGQAVVRAVDGVSLEVGAGERVAIVGESGSGKSVTARALLGLVAPGGRITEGSVQLEGRELRSLKKRAMAKVRGQEIGLVLQDPRGALDPLKTIGQQLRQPLKMHRGLKGRAADAEAIELLRRVRMSDPETRVNQYPHELSGGMCQRVVIASVIAAQPKLLIADEPTSALDASTAEGVLRLIRELATDYGMAVLFITHDLSMVAKFADRVLVMYMGRIAEEAAVDDLFQRPRHPYTRGLLDSIPGRAGRRPTDPIPGSVPDSATQLSGCAFHSRCKFVQEICTVDVPALEPPRSNLARRSACHFQEELAPVLATTGEAPADSSPIVESLLGDELLRVESLSKSFALRAGPFKKSGSVRAVADVTFSIRAGEVLALVGESGSGKSTTARMILGLENPTSGKITFRGEDLGEASERSRELRRQLQVVFQNPDSSLDPRLRAGAVITQPLAINKIGTAKERRQRACELLEQVGMSATHVDRYPHEFSGGQRQRIAIARALAVRPELIVCDEPVTALDVSVQAQILNLLQDIQHREALSYLFIAHDLSVVRQLADRVAVMYLGRIVELSDADAFFAGPEHPYSAALLSAAGLAGNGSLTDTGAQPTLLEGEAPSSLTPPSGCSFHPRCWKSEKLCEQVRPDLTSKSAGRFAACHFPEPPSKGSPLIHSPATELRSGGTQ